MPINKVKETDWRRGWGVVQQKKELSLGKGGKDIQAPSPVPGSRVTLPGSETLPIVSKDSGVWRSVACREVMFQGIQAGSGLSVLGGSESSQLPAGS